MKSLYFDVDDTLYNQLIPFKKAFSYAFPEIRNKKIEKLYQLFRQKSDEVFPSFQKKQISEEDMWITRMSLTLNAFGVSNIPRKQVLKFQRKYNFYLLTIQPYREIINLMRSCRQKQIRLGIITNGTQEHQLNKIKALGVLNFINENDIFVSESLLVAKPDPRIFKHVLDVRGDVANQTYYLGDNFLNDVVGPSEVGIHPIWFNVRNRHLPNLQLKPALEIQRLADLNETLNLILNSKGS